MPSHLGHLVWQWLTRTPKVIAIMKTDTTVTCMTQIGIQIFVGMAEQGIFVYDEDGRCVTSWRLMSPTREINLPVGLAESSRGELVVLSHSLVHVFQPHGTFVREFGQACFTETLPSCMAVTAHDEVLVACGNQIFTFRLSDGVCVRTWPHLRRVIFSMCIMPEGKHLLCPNWDEDCLDMYCLDNHQLVRCWRPPCHARLFQLPYDVVVWQNRIFVVHFLRVHLFRMQDRETLQKLDGLTLCGVHYPQKLLVTRRGRMWLFGSQTLAVSDLRRGS